MSAAKQRLCHITKWDHFDGYGFDLHAEKGKPGQYIGKVDDASPAEAAGLRQGDRIIEVNGAPIEGKTHREVVDLIKTVPNETKLLVVSDSKSPCNSKKIDIDTQIKNGTKNGNTQNGNTNTQLTNNNINGEIKIEQTITNGDQHSHEITERPENTTKTSSTNGSLGTASDSAPATPMGGATGGATGLNLNMTAAELRARLAAKKKFDPKKESSMDFKKKFDMIQKL